MKPRRLLLLVGIVVLILALALPVGAANNGPAPAPAPSVASTLSLPPALPPVPASPPAPVEAEISFEGDVPLKPNVGPIIVLSGSDYEMGYQYYYQLVKIYGPWIMLEYQYYPPWVLARVAHPEPWTEEELVALRAHQWYLREYAPEFIDMFQGMADGATDAGAPLTYEEVLAHVMGLAVYPAPPGSEDEELPPRCSGFAAWGSATTDGELIAVGITDGEMSFEVTIIAFPEDGGNNFIYTPYRPTFLDGGHPGMNNRGLVYVHHGNTVSPPDDEWGYGITGGIAVLHTLRFADDAEEAVEMMLDMEVEPFFWEGDAIGGLWADVSGNVFCVEHREDPEVIREAGDYGETDFLYAANNCLSEEMGKEGRIYIPHGGWTRDINGGSRSSSVCRNLGMWNMLDNYQGEVDLEFAKMMCRFAGEPTVKADGEVWDMKICNLSNAIVGICLPDDGDEGLYYLSYGCATRLGSSFGPGKGYYRIAPTYSFYQLKLDSSPSKVSEAAMRQAQYELYYANQELGKLSYWDVPYAPLDEKFNEAATEWQKGEYYQGIAKTTTGNESIFAWAKSIRAFTRCQALAKKVYNALVPPATSPQDLVLHPYTYDNGKTK